MKIKYRHFIIKKFTNTLIKEGKRFKAINLFTKLLSFIKKKGNNSSLENLLLSIETARPTLSFRKIRKGSKYMYLPKLLSYENQLKQSINWLITFSKKKNNNKKFLINLSNEIASTLEGQGEAVKEKNRINYLLIDGRPFLYLVKYYEKNTKKIN